MRHINCLSGLLALVLTLSLAGCGHRAEPTPPEPPVSDTPPAVEEETPPPWTGPFNPLTGLPLEKGAAEDRPVAIMLNNIKQALPQQGIAQADLLYEVPAEGGITRMLGVYQNTEDVGEIGSIRSARPYYLELALGHDAIYLHAGGSPDAYEKIRAWNVTALDCVRGSYEGTLFWRDADRRANMGYEHSVLTSGAAIAAYFPGYSLRRTHEAGFDPGLHFTEDGTPEDGTPAARITVPVSHYKTGVFDYDADSGQYLVSEYGAPYVDGNTGEQVGVRNVLVLNTACRPISGDDKGRLQVELTAGEGWYACGGKAVPITWRKDGRNAPLRYCTADGTELLLGQGRSYVCIVPLSCETTFE